MKEQREYWLPIPGFPDYLVSDQGKVRSTRFGKDRLLKGGVGNGYRIVCLHVDGKQISKNIHSLVMLAFIGPAPKGAQVRHLDGSRDNNNLNNLTYGTPRENSADMLLHGTNHNANKTECPSGHPYNEENTRVSETKAGGHARSCRTCERRLSKRECQPPRSLIDLAVLLHLEPIG